MARTSPPSDLPSTTAAIPQIDEGKSVRAIEVSKCRRGGVGHLAATTTQPLFIPTTRIHHEDDK